MPLKLNELCTHMMIRYALLFALVISATYTRAQCSVSLPADTVTLYWGYDPLACADLTPVVAAAQPAALVWSNGFTSASIQVCDTTSAWYFVTLTDDTLCAATDSVFVNVVDVHCGNNGNKVLVCHIPPGNPANAHPICISPNGVPAHLAHGCRLGTCGAASNNNIAPNELELSVYPNPMSSGAAVSIHSGIAQRVSVTVVDALGRRSTLLLDADLAAQETRDLMILPAHLPQGARFCWVEATSANERRVQRVVVMP